MGKTNKAFVTFNEAAVEVAVAVVHSEADIHGLVVENKEFVGDSSKYLTFC